MRVVAFEMSQVMGIEEEIKQGRWGRLGPLSTASGTTVLSFTEGMPWVSPGEGRAAAQGDG